MLPTETESLAQLTLTDVRILHPLHFDGVVIKRHCIAVFEERPHEVIHVWILRWLNNELATIRGAADMPFFNDNLAAFHNMSFGKLTLQTCSVSNCAFNLRQPFKLRLLRNLTTLAILSSKSESLDTP